jgi:hypothetical protein
MNGVVRVKDCLRPTQPDHYYLLKIKFLICIFFFWVYINGMILTPTITIDNNNLASFNKEIKEFDRTPGNVTKHWGSRDLDGLSIELKKINTSQGNGVLIMATDTTGDVMLTARLISAPVPPAAFQWSRKVYVIDRVRVHNDYVGQGITPGIYRWLTDMGYTLISDSHQTPVSLAVWRKLGTAGGVYTLNLEDGMYRPYDPLRVEDWMLFGNNNLMKYWPIRFLLPAK